MRGFVTIDKAGSGDGESRDLTKEKKIYGEETWMVRESRRGGETQRKRGGE